MKKILITIMLVLFSIVSVNASTSKLLDLDEKCRLNITFMYNETTPIEGATFSFWKVADVSIENSNVKYAYTETFNSLNLPLDNLEKTFSGDASKNPNIQAVADIVGNRISNINIITGANGKGTTGKNLEVGLYLVTQTEKVPGYSIMPAFMITLPQIADNSEYEYDVESLPKPQIDRMMNLVIKKVWNPNAQAIPENITITLLNAGIEVMNVTLTEENNWTYVTDEEQIIYSDSYVINEKEVPDGYKVQYQQDYKECYDEETNTLTLTAINTGKLPQTGAFTYIIPIFASIGIMFMALGFYLERKESKNE